MRLIAIETLDDDMKIFLLAGETRYKLREIMRLYYHWLFCVVAVKFNKTNLTNKFDSYAPFYQIIIGLSSPIRAPSAVTPLDIVFARKRK